MKSNEIKAIVTSVLNEAEQGTPVKLESINLGDKTLFRFSYRNKEGIILQRKVLANEKGKDWEILSSQNQLFAFKQLKANEEISIEYKDKIVYVQSSKPFQLTLWNAEKLELSVESIQENAIAKFVLNTEGWQHLSAASEIVKQNPPDEALNLPEGKKIPAYLRGVNLCWLDNQIFFTAVGQETIANRMYNQPRSPGRKSSKRLESGNVTLPIKAVDLMNSFGAGSGNAGDVIIYVDQKQALIENADVAVVVDLIEGKFPQLEKFHPAKGDKAEVDKAALIKALEALVEKAKGTQVPTEITLSCDSGKLTVQCGEKSKTIPTESKPFKAVVQLMGDTLLGVLKAIAAAKISLMFPVKDKERLVVSATDGMYVLTGLVIETVNYVKEKLSEQISEAPQEQILEEEELEDGTKVILKKTELPQSGEPPKDGSLEEVAKAIKQADAATQAATAAVREETDPERRDLLQAGIERLKSVFADMQKPMVDDEIRFAGAISLFWTSERLHLITFKMTQKSRIFIDWVTEDVPQSNESAALPATSATPAADSNKVVPMQRNRK